MTCRHSLPVPEWSTRVLLRGTCISESVTGASVKLNCKNKGNISDNIRSVVCKTLVRGRSSSLRRLLSSVWKLSMGDL